MSKVYNIILSGGSGTRLWPLSRESKPKQFLQLFQGKSLFQETVSRNKEMVNAFGVITNANQFDLAKNQAQDLNCDFDLQIIEPVGRNTAPAIALACFAMNGDDVLFVTPSDQMIQSDSSYQGCLMRSIELAKEGYLVTFGLKPRHADTGFGYIEHEGELVHSFREKPDVKTAEEFLNAGNFLWNSGMFCFTAGVFLEELKKYRPDIFDAAKQAFETSKDGKIELSAMKAIPAESVDYAVFEHSDKIKVVPSDFYWTDLGSFDALLDYGMHEQVDSMISMDGVDVENVYGLTYKKLVGVGIQDLLIVDTEDTIFVMKKGASSNVKTIYNKVKEESPDLLK